MPTYQVSMKTDKASLITEIAKLTDELKCLKDILTRVHQNHIIVNCWGEVISAPMDYEMANEGALFHNMAMSETYADVDKGYRKLVTCIPYRWKDTNELVLPDLWKDDYFQFSAEYRPADFLDADDSF